MNKQEVLQTIAEYIVNLKNAINEVIIHFSNEEETKAFNLIYYITEGLQWLIDALVLTEDAQKVKIRKEDIESINEKLKEILEAMINQDFTLIGDLFQFEILPILEKFEYNLKEYI